MKNICNYSMPAFNGIETTTKKTSIEEDLNYLTTLKSNFLKDLDTFKRTRTYSEKGDYTHIDISSPSGKKIFVTKELYSDFLSVSTVFPDGESKHTRTITIEDTSDKTLQQRILNAINDTWEAIKRISKQP